MFKFIKKSIGFVVLLIIMGFAFQNYQESLLTGLDAPEEIPFEDFEGIEINDELTSLNIDVPFYSQAPHANWDYPWQEACEEASVLLVANIYNEMNLGLEDYNTELLRLVDWEIETFGAYEHTTVEQTVQMITENYALETVVHTDPSFITLQSIINEGNLIVAPFAGKLLENPNFRNGGPTYHMLVIKGYDAEKNQVVTHDVGTRNGENYVYQWETIQAALHDWHDDDILLGSAQFIEVIRP